MIFIHTLRMMADLSVYFFIAELVTVSLGGTSQFIPFILLCISYGLLAFMQKGRFSNLWLVLPVAVLFLPVSNKVALLAPLGYILFLLYRQQTTLSWDRQSELFTMTARFFPVAGVFLCFLGYSKDFLQYSVPMAFVSLVTSIFLMRMLRQPPAVYLNPDFQRKNITVFAVIMGAGWLFSRDFVFAMIGKGMSYMYMKTVYPVLNAFVYVFMGLLRIVMYIFSRFNLHEIKFEENHLSGGEMGPSFKDAIIGSDHVMATQSVLTVIVVIAFLVCAFYFFRWLALHKGEESFVTRGIEMLRGKDTSKIKKERATTTALQIRRQYRIFLKLYKDKGGKIETSHTSQDVLAGCGGVMPDASADILAEMRNIYIRARYGGTVTKNDLKRIKQINKDLSAKP